MALFTTFITTPLVTAIYKPARKATPYKHRKIQRDKPEDELRILACLHSTRSITAMINLIEASRGIRKPALRLYIMHLVELSERSSAIMMVHKARKNGLPFCNRNRSQEYQVAVAFEPYGQLSKVTVKPMTAISAFHDMHEDICKIADEKRIAMIILPFHEYPRVDGVLESLNPAFETVSQRVLEHAPCSVGILVDRGRLGDQSQLAPSKVDHHVAVLFFGGPDDREALVFGRRMAEHPGIKLTVIRFLPASEFEHTAIDLPSLATREPETDPKMYRMKREQEKKVDEEALQVINNDVSCMGGSIVYEEREMNSNTVESVLAIRQSNEYHMFLVGRGRFPSYLLADLTARSAEYPELGPIGDLLAAPSSTIPMSASILVIQQHDAIHSLLRRICGVDR